MKSNAFNICPTCIHKDECVLTVHKSQVWSCSEFDDVIEEVPLTIIPQQQKNVRINWKKSKSLLTETL